MTRAGPASTRIVAGITLAASTLGCGGPERPHVLYHNPLRTLEGILSRDGLRIDGSTSRGSAIRIDAPGPRTVRLAEVRTGDAETVVLTYRGHVRTEGLAGRAYLEMRCGVPGGGELVSPEPSAPATGTTDWVTQVTRLSLGRRPGVRSVRLNVQIDGTGVVWVSNVLLAQAGR